MTWNLPGVLPRRLPNRRRPISEPFRPALEPLEARLAPSVSVLTYHNDNLRTGLNSHETFKHDIPNAVVRFFDTGHFALETHAAEIGAAIRDFLAR